MNKIPNVIDAHGSDEIPIQLRNIGRYRTCCFTGHRRKELPDSGKESSPSMLMLRKMTEQHIRRQLEQGIDHFVTGMSSGFDILAADILLNTPDISKEMQLICAVPYKDQAREMKTQKELMIYQQAAQNAYVSVVFFGKYSPKCYRVRNQFMVNCSSSLIAYMDSPENHGSGTAQTINMAKKAELQTNVIYKYQIEEALKGQG